MEKISTFQQKIDIILRIKEINIKDIEKALGVDGTFYKAYNENREPREKLLAEFQRKFHVKESWWKNPKGDQASDVFDEKGTYVETPMENNQNGHSVKETFYRDLIENNEEYSLLPRAVLKDYKIVPDQIINVIIQSNENEKKAIEKSMTLELESLNRKYELIIEGYENKIKRLETKNQELEKEKEDLLRKIPAHN